MKPDNRNSGLGERWKTAASIVSFLLAMTGLGILAVLLAAYWFGDLIAKILGGV